MPREEQEASGAQSTVASRYGWFGLPNGSPLKGSFVVTECCHLHCGAGVWSLEVSVVVVIGWSRVTSRLSP